MVIRSWEFGDGITEQEISVKETNPVTFRRIRSIAKPNNNRSNSLGPLVEDEQIARREPSELKRSEQSRGQTTQYCQSDNPIKTILHQNSILQDSMTEAENNHTALWCRLNNEFV
jgi:hypothetical protein